MAAQGSAFTVTSDGTVLSGESAGEGPAIVLLHGLTATRRYVVMGSRLLERRGHRVVSYDARGHGSSEPAGDRAGYGYAQLAGDLRAVLDAVGAERAILVGASMGAHTALRVALEQPARALALCLITPAFDPAAASGERELSSWDALAAGLRRDGVDGFVRAYDLGAAPARWRETVERVLRQRLAAHQHPAAVADALEVVPRSRPFESFDDLAALAVPTVVVASRDEADPGHPLALGARYARAIAGAELVVEGEGESPIAWQGGALSRLVDQLSERASAHSAAARTDMR